MAPSLDHAESFHEEALRDATSVELAPDAPDEIAARHEVATSPAYIAARHHNPHGTLHPLPSETVNDAQAFVRLEHGRWIVDCPFCPSAQHASASDHRFFCAKCRNEDAGFQFVGLVWPSEGRVDAIEEVVSVREEKNQHWSPGETLKSLRDENRDHGLPLK